ncbi:uncharacterized protein LOC112345594 [Selaginella moellendorffii]|uniref:uncharacterized protein LOC112345594 n=1 Tax=Selaginella moellendorffii TaxID=88036 RepID=UPI000D1CEA0B|nr:uncharacterized protein LOC112345594 [Selaginella moellendorffii]|eukprot:XP_024528484.1 uncharacterized protein LOC112345594 [Selaginella moellendorffii]
MWKPAPELYQTMDGRRLLHNSSGPLRHRERPREASRKMEHPGLRKRREYLMRGLDNNVGSLLECRCRKPRVEHEVRSMSLVNYDRDTMLVIHLCDLLQGYTLHNPKWPTRCSLRRHHEKYSRARHNKEEHSEALLQQEPWLRMPRRGRSRGGSKRLRSCSSS